MRTAKALIKKNHFFVKAFISACLVLATHSLVRAEEPAYSGEAARDYNAICGPCHLPNGGYAVFSLGRRLGKDKAILHERDGLTPEFITHSVRKGYLAMPPFSQVEVSDKELEEIIQYLTRKPVDK